MTAAIAPRFSHQASDGGISMQTELKGEIGS